MHGIVVSGHQVLDGQRRWAASGVIRGYDAVTGELRFAWDIKVRLAGREVKARNPHQRAASPDAARCAIRAKSLFASFVQRPRNRNPAGAKQPTIKLIDFIRTR